MKIRIIISVLLCTCTSLIYAQTDLKEVNIQKLKPRIIQIGDYLENDTFYTGIDSRFVLSFADNNYIQARFFGIDGHSHYQKIPYLRKGDTIILDNYQKPRIPWSVCATEEVPTQVEAKNGIPVTISFFISMMVEEKRVSERRLVHEEIYFVDSVSHHVFIPYNKTHCRYSSIIVVFANNVYARLYKPIDTSLVGSYSNDFLKLDLDNCFSSMATKAMFDSFPLIIRNDSIFPIDKGVLWYCSFLNGPRKLNLGRS